MKSCDKLNNLQKVYFAYNFLNYQRPNTQSLLNKNKEIQWMNGYYIKFQLC